MTTSRIMFKKRITPTGEIDPTADADLFIDIKETKKAFYERGRGPAYQKTVYTFKKDGDDRTYDDTMNIQVEDGLGNIPYEKVIKKMKTIESGRGPSYQKTVVVFDNSDQNDQRVTRVKTVTGDDGSHVDVERIDKFNLFTGRGPAYQKKRVWLKNQDEDLED